MGEKISVTILGASGYTGAELIRLLYTHPKVDIQYLVADSNAGKSADAIFSHLKGYKLPQVVKADQVDWASQKVVFSALPHAATQAVLKGLPKHLKIIDLSADFRIEDPATYQQWYEHAHQALEMQKEAVYGLTELNRAAIKKSRVIACPGCYPTSMLLPLQPLLKAGVIQKDGIIVDSKSGISGAGRSLKQPNLFAEANENIRAYGIAGHRHVAEVEQELAKAAGADLQITFTPHVIPVNRGILSVIYAQLAKGKTAADAKVHLQKTYQGEPFVQIVDEAPVIRDVVYTNQARIAVFADRIPGRLILVSVIDNLIKGASGQGVQNFNLIHGFDETLGLEAIACYP